MSPATYGLGVLVALFVGIICGIAVTVHFLKHGTGNLPPGDDRSHWGGQE